MRCSRVVWSGVIALVAVASIAAGCNDAITLEVASDRPVPTGIDSICVGIGDLAPDGGQFGRLYRLEDRLAGFPQTLRVEPGNADAAWAWVRADRGGVPAARAQRRVDFGDDVTLVVDRCERGAGASLQIVGDPVGPPDARLVASHGVGGARVIAVADGTTSVIDAEDGGLVELDPPPPAPAGGVSALTAVDIDGDCDDDLVIVSSESPPVIWRRDGIAFVEAGSVGGSPVAAIAAADVDRDGDIDLVTGAGATLQLWRNDASGTFTADPAALSSGGRATAIRALALGDLDGDGNPDLVVGQAGAPLVAWLGAASGSFASADAVVPAVPLDVAHMTLVDVDADFDPDLVVAVTGAPLRLYIDRDGRLEDQTFVRMPEPTIARAIAFGGWDDGCEPDAIIAADPESQTLRGQPGGALASDTTAPPASDVVIVDLDDDGLLDAVLATPEGARWLAR